MHDVKRDLEDTDDVQDDILEDAVMNRRIILDEDDVRGNPEVADEVQNNSEGDD